MSEGILLAYAIAFPAALFVVYALLRLLELPGEYENGEFGDDCDN